MLNVALIDTHVVSKTTPTRFSLSPDFRVIYTYYK